MILSNLQKYIHEKYFAIHHHFSNLHTLHQVLLGIPVVSIVVHKVGGMREYDISLLYQLNKEATINLDTPHGLTEDFHRSS